MRNIYCVVCTFFLLAFFSCTREYRTTVTSPDGKIKVETGIEEGKPFYKIEKGDKKIIEKSFLGFILKGNDAFNKDFIIKNTEFKSFSEKWTQPWGEETTVDNTYNEMTLRIAEKSGKKRELSIVFRVFNDGVGFRYVFPKQPNLNDFTIMDEVTEFALVGNPQTWSIPTNHTNYFEHLYKKAPVTSLDTVCTPLTMQVNDSLYLAIHEANLTDYAGLNLTPKQGSSTLKADLTPWSTGEKVFAKTPFQTPWRTIIIARNPGDLMLSRLMLNLNEPSKITDTSWIQPGRYIGIWWGMHMEAYTWKQGPKHGATTANAMRYIDFAAKHGFSGVLVEGWNYGWDGDWSKDGTHFNFTKAYPDYDLAKVTEYAAKNHVKIIGHNETGGATKNYEAQLDSAFALYSKLGISCVKTGYVNPLLDHKEQHASQYGVRHYRKVIETAARYKIMIDNHEPMMPTGLQRTYPNLMSQEGVRGQEYDAWSPDGGNPPEHTTIIPFTRGLAGPMDFTPGTFKFENPVLPKTHVHTTLAKQLALAVVLFSPLQMASDMIENYEGNPAFEFITSCPTNWAKTVIPEAAIGDYLLVARKDRKSNNWFVGGITDENARKLSLSLSFLDKDKKYKAKLYRDGKGADYKTNPYPVDIEEIEVSSSSTLQLNLAPGGGIAIAITRE
ncbi:MAG: glycoside hydrolase family 97 protein [Bacteroidota bacterium]|nr:glycoside hydrolase family 97 protein [Bacteroidota bacterium]